MSRKIEDREERSRLRAVAREALGDRSGGVIVRTVSEELNRKTIEKELATLRKTFSKIERRVKSMKAPALVHREEELTSGIIRDLFSEKIDLLTVNDDGLHHEIRSYLGQVGPELLDRVREYEGDTPIFDHFGLEEEIRAAFHRRVELKSGGHIVIEHTEALVSIDVNTGRYTGKKDPAKTILRTNLDAAGEIARQLRLRDIGGIIVCDFIDMDDKEAREKVQQEMKSYLGRDRARTWTRRVRSRGSFGCAISAESSCATSSTWTTRSRARRSSRKSRVIWAGTGLGPRCSVSRISGCSS